MAGMKGLDDYIMGVHDHREDDVRHICPECKMVKFIRMNFDMGGWFYGDDDDPYCEKCQVEMVIEERNNDK
jgi:ssDNA-binding Zn-finger/Zn-ribbon topoisomerase 1